MLATTPESDMAVSPPTRRPPVIGKISQTITAPSVRFFGSSFCTHFSVFLRR